MDRFASSLFLILIFVFYALTRHAVISHMDILLRRRVPLSAAFAHEMAVATGAITTALLASTGRPSVAAGALTHSPTHRHTHTHSFPPPPPPPPPIVVISFISP